jgi:hypothetical protein
VRFAYWRTCSEGAAAVIACSHPVLSVETALTPIMLCGSKVGVSDAYRLNQSRNLIDFSLFNRDN